MLKILILRHWRRCRLILILKIHFRFMILPIRVVMMHLDSLSPLALLLLWFLDFFNIIFFLARRRSLLLHLRLPLCLLGPLLIWPNFPLR